MDGRVQYRSTILGKEPISPSPIQFCYPDYSTRLPNYLSKQSYRIKSTRTSTHAVSYTHSLIHSLNHLDHDLTPYNTPFLFSSFLFLTISSKHARCAGKLSTCITFPA